MFRYTHIVRGSLDRLTLWRMRWSATGFARDVDLEAFAAECIRSRNAPTTNVIADEQAGEIDRILDGDGLVHLRCQLARATDLVRDGIALMSVFKKDSIEAQELCLSSGVMVAEGWLCMVVIQGQIKGFGCSYPKGTLRRPR